MKIQEDTKSTKQSKLVEKLPIDQDKEDFVYSMKKLVQFYNALPDVHCQQEQNDHKLFKGKDL